jgi:hypothetical protein
MLQHPTIVIGEINLRIRTSLGYQFYFFNFGFAILTLTSEMARLGRADRLTQVKMIGRTKDTTAGEKIQYVLENLFKIFSSRKKKLWAGPMEAYNKLPLNITYSTESCGRILIGNKKGSKTDQLE